MVIHHMVLVQSPATRDLYASDRAADLPLFGWLLTYTPLHLPWLGTANVLVFFALSGFALASPLVDRPVGRPIRYWLSRGVRLYVPAWASLAFGLVIFFLAIRLSPDFASTAFADRIEHLNASTVGRDALLVPGHVSSLVNGVLWSLSWEVAFSCAVPLIALWLRHCERKGVPTLGAIVPVALLLGAAVTVDVELLRQAALYTATFLGGAGLAFAHRHAAANGGRRPLKPWETVTWSLGLPITLCAHWLVLPLAPTDVVLRCTEAITALSAIATVWFVINAPTLRRLLESRVALYAGTLSFSLYLTHAPVLEFVDAVSGHAPWATLVGATASVPVAELFRRVIEQPSQSLARTIRGRTTRRHRAPTLPDSDIPSHAY
ncbi:acyltransferase [Curtobacterium sp. GD1]|nr:acyltransferase [Curtobacterium sp. GD1]